MTLVGFLEYACSIFFVKDWLKTKILISSKFQFPQFFHDKDGFACIFPEPNLIENENEESLVSLFGYHFLDDVEGKRQLASLFRAAVFHLGAHVMSSHFEDYEDWRKGKDPRLANFVSSLLEDVNGIAYLSSLHHDKLVDLAFANTLSLKRLYRIANLVNPATRLMAGLLVSTHTGLIVAKTEEERRTVARLTSLLDQFKHKALTSSTTEKTSLKNEKLKIADEIYLAIEDAGTITETPFLPHTEELSPCSTFPPSFLVKSDTIIEDYFMKCLEFIGGSPSFSNGEQKLKKIAEAEASQVFDSWKRQKERDKKIISQYESFSSLTRFKSVEIPEQDYTEFLRVRAGCKSECRRLLESLLVARDAVDEDPRKLYGVLDLQEVIQVIASKSPRMDVFLLDENISKSYSWIILFDTSKSMECIKDLALEILIVLADAANEALLDPNSWGVYAFSDRLFIIKDFKERYNARVKSRIGGLKFEGFTYTPDALSFAGQVIRSRAESMRLITIISDGWPFGYSGIKNSLSETVDSLTKCNISLVGIGAQTRRMKSFFKSNCSVYTLRDLTKQFSNLYLEASRVTAES